MTHGASPPIEGGVSPRATQSPARMRPSGLRLTMERKQEGTCQRQAPQGREVPDTESKDPRAPGSGAGHHNPETEPQKNEGHPVIDSSPGTQ